MPNPVSETEVWTPTIQSIADGEALNAANLALGVKGLADRTAILRKGTPGVGTSVTWRVPMPAVGPLLNTNTRFAYANTGSGQHMWTQTDITTAGDIRFHIAPTPLLGKVDRIAAWVSSASGSVALPATKPTVRAFKLEGVSGSYTQLGTTIVDPSTTGTTYNIPHYIEVTGLAEPIVSGKEFAISITGEAGSLAQVSSFRVLGLEVTFIP